MAHNLSLGVIAEGVENEISADLLKSLGCNFAQGYLFSRAVTAEGVGELLQNS